MRVSVVIITRNEEQNLPRTLRSVQPLVANGQGEIIVVDSGSTDRTCEIAREFGADVYVEEWKGFAAQKNSAIAKAKAEWILSLDADEELSPELQEEIGRFLASDMAKTDNRPNVESSGSEARNHWGGLRIPRKNMFLGRWIRYGGFYPDMKLRLIRKGCGDFDERPVHETATLKRGLSGTLASPIIHHAYPTLEAYIEHMNRYSSLGAEVAVDQGQVSRSFFAFLYNTFMRPRLTFVYNYFLRLGFLDGREGYLLHFYHSIYVSWKYAKAWEAARKSGGRQ